MNSFAHGLNSGLLHIAARMDVMASQNYPVLSSLKISALDRVWMLSLNEAQLVALDRTPVSILRFNMSRNMYDLPTDANFAKASFNNYMMAESINYIHCTQSDPYLSLGIGLESLEWYTGKGFMERIGVCDHESFDVRIRVDTKRLRKDLSPESSLINTCLILSTELNFRTRENGYEYNGYVQNYGSRPHEAQIQMREMLEAGVRTSLVAAATGQDKRDVINGARRLQKGGADISNARGRLQTAETVFKLDRLQPELFMLIYRFVGKDVKQALNSKAAIYAFKQFDFMLDYMGYERNDRLTINDCIVLANGVLSGELLWSKCQSCGTHYTINPNRRFNPCTFC